MRSSRRDAGDLVFNARSGLYEYTATAEEYRMFQRLHDSSVRALMKDLSGNDPGPVGPPGVVMFGGGVWPVGSVRILPPPAPPRSWLEILAEMLGVRPMRHP